ncbi:MAG: hypothetical protein NTW25_03225 [Candidatus Kapabacteria bacterium]|nr:hypothetical protein [Candidatus Kapabacteria bacterium]
MLNFFYNFLFIIPANIIVKIIVLFDKKLADKERNWLSSLDSLNKLDKSKKNIWFHSSSMGEFEQAKPIIEQIKASSDNFNIIISFFSPSGFNNQKNYPYADAVLYMPIDTKSKSKFFINRINPSIAIFVRYDIWRNHLLELKSKNIESLLICATKSNSKLLTESNILKALYTSNLNLINEIYAVNLEQYNFFKSLELTSEVIQSFDTRNDRIIQKVNESKLDPIFSKEIFGNKKVIVAGSTWGTDEDILIHTYEKLKGKFEIQLILVPHEPTKEHLSDLILKIENYILLSSINFNNPQNVNKEVENKIVIVDSIGKLLQLYANADIAYIGGGFGAGVHSVTEPAGYGIPVISGPKFRNSPDAVEMFKRESFMSVESEESLSKTMDKLLSNGEFLTKISKLNYEYIQEGKGESTKLSDIILSKLL